MKIGIDLGFVAPDESDEAVPLLQGVLGRLFADHPEQEAVLFGVPETIDLFDCHIPPSVDRVILPAERFDSHLDWEAARQGLHVLFRGSITGASLRFPLSRQVVFASDLRHQYLWEFYSQKDLDRRYNACQTFLDGAGAIGAPTEGMRQAVQSLSRSRRSDAFLMSLALPANTSPASLSDLSPEERRSLPEKDFFLYPACLAPHKNHLRLLRAFERFLSQSPDRFELILTGDPCGWPELAAGFPGLPVRHIGRVRQEFLDVLYQRATSMAFFSLYEGFGLPLLEAFRAGTPVICSKTFGPGEVAGDAALTCDPTDVKAMADALRCVACDPALRRRLIARGRERLAVYRWQDGAENLLEACRRVAGAAPALSPASLPIRRAARLASRVVRGVGRRAMGVASPWLIPQLGIMRQHSPRPLVIPTHYSRIAPPDPAPLISIVTPSYNQADYLEQTMRSVLDQGYPRLEYIVQDGGSTDASRSLLERYGDRLAHWDSSPDRGQAHAINLGLQRASGEICAYLNSDDLLLPGSLSYVARIFKAHPEIDVVYGHRLVVDAEGRETARWYLPPHDNDFIAWDDYIPQETMFWRRRIWERVGAQMDESFHFALDWDLILRFRAAGAKFRRLSRFLGAFRNHAQQKTMTLLNVYYPEVRRLRERCFGGPTPLRRIIEARRSYFAQQIFYQRLHALGLLAA